MTTGPRANLENLSPRDPRAPRRPQARAMTRSAHKRRTRPPIPLDLMQHAITAALAATAAGLAISAAGYQRDIMRAPSAAAAAPLAAPFLLTTAGAAITLLVGITAAGDTIARKR